MQDKARLFAYSTWGLMISLGALLFTQHFFNYMAESPAVLILVLAGTGAIYFNLTFAAVKRFIRKVPEPTNSHIFLALLIAAPPAFWIAVITEPFTIYSLFLLLILALSAGAGTVYGNRAGIKARYEYIQKLKEYRKNNMEI